MIFEWHADKARENRRKHRITFPEALTVFADPLSLTYADPDHWLAEERLITVGLSRKGRILLVVHLEDGQNIRIINARRATGHEREHYEENH